MLQFIPRINHLGVAKTPSVALMRSPVAVGGGGASSGLLFASNSGIDSSIKGGWYLGGSALPDIAPLTIILKALPFAQEVVSGHSTYFTFFFHGRSDGAFVPNSDYFGCHPYPDPPTSGVPAKWEVSASGTDDITDENGNNTSVEFGRWHRQATVVRPGSGSDDIIDFYWDLGTSSNRLISHTASGGLVNSAVTPRLFFGETYWATERASGVLRGIQVYQAALSLAHVEALSALETDAEVLAYCSANSITPWYVNMNQTPDDITDKSGAGHHGTWMDASNKPRLWTTDVYFNQFSATENPLSDSSAWRQGETHGLDWHNVKTVNGKAVGAHIADGPSYDDSIACLTGFPRGQYIQGVLFFDAGYSPPGGHEAELHLHCTINANSITSYELLLDPTLDGTQIVRWDGAVGNLYFSLTVTDHNGGPATLADGQVWRFEDDGAGNFSVYQDGVLRHSFTDTTHQGGSPGIAMFWINAGNDGDRVGWRHIEAGPT